MNRLMLIFVFLIGAYTCANALSIETNDLTDAYTVDITNIFQYPTYTNMVWNTVTELELPNSYLQTGEIDFMEPENPLRRFDISFFVSIPIAFYLTLNILEIRNDTMLGLTTMGTNAGNERRDPKMGTPEAPMALGTTAFRYVLLNTIFIPLYVAFDDYFYMKEEEPEWYKKTDESQNSGLFFGYNMINLQF